MRKEKFEVDGGKCMSDLYVSDLDGTLLRSNEVTSKYTNQVINSLVEEGMIFSYATARSLVTAKKVTEGINAKIPLIVYNGAFVIDNITEKILIANYFDDSVHSGRPGDRRSADRGPRYDRPVVQRPLGRPSRYDQG